MSFRSATTRLSAKLYTMPTGTQTRMLSAQGNMAMKKLQQVFEEYRMTNYSQEMPSRFKKEIVSAAKERNEEIILIEGLQRVLHNIGASHKISSSEMELIFNEFGVSGYITSERMVNII